MTRKQVLIQACDQCLQELYSKVQPAVSWEDFKEQNREYSNKYREWHIKYNQSMGNEPSLKEYCGPAPYEFYYLPKQVMKEIYDSYVDVYKMDAQQNLLDIIQILKGYCLDPIVDVYIEGENGCPGYRDYEHTNNLEKEITKILGPEAEDNPYHVHKICDKFFEFLDMAGEFYNWNSELNGFATEIYLGPSPNSNKEAVINNWKQYRGKDIEINESIYDEED